MKYTDSPNGSLSKKHSTKRNSVSGNNIPTEDRNRSQDAIQIQLTFTLRIGAARSVPLANIVPTRIADPAAFAGTLKRIVPANAPVDADGLVELVGLADDLPWLASSNIGDTPESF